MNLKHQSWWLLAGIAVCTTAQALPQQTQVPADPAPASSDVKIAIDPRTGQLRAPTDEEIRQLEQQSQARQNARQRRAEPLAAGKRGFVAPATATEAAAAQRALPAGGVAQPVPENLMTNVTVARDANGQLVIRHAADGAQGAAKGGDDE